eukprot:CAMPEP_0197552378 /NCGR_PEP_ID=MMETSP1320-20131121/5890_1 /TAXON_ID=91990 /ORGANISM="Bolidomonas sp., Strain RCC2347" /LENGTH=757 /DNA_ID=CAMNT_0043112957 /DNA_START=37 /DNA_END=2310 /DNA_ORIENTATION=+
MKFALFAGLVAAASATNPTFIDYQCTSDVTEHGEIDLDVAAILTAVNLGTDAGVTTAVDIYTNGQNSAKSSGLRNLKGFATSGEAKMIGEFQYSLFRAAGNAADDMDTMTVATLGTAAGVKQEEAAMSINFRNTYIYTLHELLDAYADRSVGTTTDNDNAVKAWDEGVAFYVGSTATKGVCSLNSIYGMFECFGQHFTSNGGATSQDTDNISAQSDINAFVMGKFAEGKAIIDGSTFGDTEKENLLKITDEINSAIVKGLVQMYIWVQKTTTSGVAQLSPIVVADLVAQKTKLTKVIGSVIHHEVNACDTDSAALVEANMIAADQNFDATLGALQKNYKCLGFNCISVGAFFGASSGVSMCDDGAQYPDQVETITDNGNTYAISAVNYGYTPGSEVAAHALLDKDLLRIGLYMGQADYANAYRTYSKGRNSVKGSGVVRNYQAFSKGASKMAFSEMDTYKAYFGNDAEFNDKFITAVILGQTDTTMGAAVDYSTVAADARKEIAVKSIQYATTFHYVLREFYDAIDDCKIGNQAANQDGVHAWDEGVVFWAGSLEGADGSGTGQVLAALAEKRAGNYPETKDTTKMGSSVINDSLMADFNAGKTYLQAGSCTEAEALIPGIVSKMITPIIQSAQRYAYYVGNGSNTDKKRAEGYAFMRAVLPLVNACDATSADTIKSNQDYFAPTAMHEGSDAVFEAYQRTLGCLGVTCAMVGDLDDGAYPGRPACTTDFEFGGPAAAAKVKGVVTALALLVGAFLW